MEKWYQALLHGAFLRMLQKKKRKTSLKHCTENETKRYTI
jgi:hypothetical protein